MNDTAAVAGTRENSGWWVPLVLGIATIIFGILFLTNPAATSVTFTLVIGMYWFARGIIDIVLMFADTTLWGWKLFVGVIGILAGWLVMSSVLETPLFASLGLGTAFVVVLGIMGIVMGVSDIAQAFMGAGWGRGILGVLMILLGIWLLAHPFSSALALPWLFGVAMIVFGGLACIAAFQLRKA